MGEEGQTGSLARHTVGSCYLMRRTKLKYALDHIDRYTETTDPIDRVANLGMSCVFLYGSLDGLREPQDKVISELNDKHATFMKMVDDHRFWLTHLLYHQTLFPVTLTDKLTELGGWQGVVLPILNALSLTFRRYHRMPEHGKDLSSAWLFLYSTTREADPTFAHEMHEVLTLLDSVFAERQTGDGSDEECRNSHR